MNSSKTELIIFRTKQMNITKKLNFRLSGKKLKPKESVHYLGITLDKFLSFENHINKLKVKLTRANGLLAKIRHYVNENTIHVLYHSLFNSHLHYGQEIWGQSKTFILGQLQKLQDRAIRIRFQTPIPGCCSYIQKTQHLENV